MPSQFPAALDSFTNPTTTDTLASVPHHLQHANANDAIEALEAKLGVDDSDDPDSMEARVSALEGGVSHTHVWGETPAGTINGTNAVFTLAAPPSPAASLMLFLNGLMQTPGGNDFTLAGGTVTFAEAPDPGATLLAHYVV